MTFLWFELQKRLKLMLVDYWDSLAIFCHHCVTLWSGSWSRSGCNGLNKEDEEQRE